MAWGYIWLKNALLKHIIYVSSVTSITVLTDNGDSVIMVV